MGNFFSSEDDSTDENHFIKDPKKSIKNKEFDLILDVRTDDERKDGYYNPSYHISLDMLEKVFPKKFTDKNIKVLIYCRTGRRASQAVEKLQNLGYKNINYTKKNYLELA